MFQCMFSVLIILHHDPALLRREPCSMRLSHEIPAAHYPLYVLLNFRLTAPLATLIQLGRSQYRIMSFMPSVTVTGFHVASFYEEQLRSNDNAPSAAPTPYSLCNFNSRGMGVLSKTSDSLVQLSEQVERLGIALGYKVMFYINTVYACRPPATQRAH
jgi:hypothetical protein